MCVASTTPVVILFAVIALSAISVVSTLPATIEAVTTELVANLAAVTASSAR